MRAPGSTVLGLVEAGETLIEIEVQTNWAPDDIKALALEEGYGINSVNSRFQRIPKGKPITGIVRHSLEQEAAASIALDRDETHVLDEPPAVEEHEVAEADTEPHGRPVEDGATTSDDEAVHPETSASVSGTVSSSLPESGTGAASANPEGNEGGPALGSAAAPAPVPPAHVPCAEDLMSAALATGDPDLEQAVVAIEEALTTLAHDLIAYESRSDALAEVRRLEAELETARIRAGLGPATPSPATPTPKPGAPRLVKGNTTGPTQSQIRAWARENGIDVNAKGSVRSDVVIAYNAAHPRAGAA